MGTRGQVRGLVLDVRCNELTSRIAFFLANEYLRALGLSGCAHQGMSTETLHSVAERYIAVAKGDMEVDGLAGERTVI